MTSSANGTASRGEVKAREMILSALRQHNTVMPADVRVRWGKLHAGWGEFDRDRPRRPA